VFAAYDMMGLSATRFWIQLIGGLVPLGFAAAFLVLAVAARIKGHLIAREASRPGLGGAVVVAGVAERAPESPPDGPLVEVDVEQRGCDGTYGHRPVVFWEETARRVVAHPFYLRRDGGRALLRVEPGDRIVIDDRLGPPEKGPSIDVRRRRAQLVDGERVFIEGRLEWGIDARVPGSDDPYRGGGGEAPILRPLGGRLVIAAQPIEDRYRRRARRWVSFVPYLLATAALVQGFAHHWYHLLWRGERVTAKIVEHSSWTSSRPSKRGLHCTVTALLPDGRRVSSECALSLCKPGAPATVPWIELPGDPGLIGEPGVHGDAAMWIGILFFLVGCLLVATERDGRSWFEGRVNDMEPGRLKRG
jgi:hypothetical protein